MDLFSTQTYGDEVHVGGCVPCDLDAIVGNVRRARSRGCGCDDPLSRARTGASPAAGADPTSNMPTNPPSQPASSVSDSPMSLIGSISNIAEVALGTAVGAGTGYALSKYVFEKSVFWPTLLGGLLGGGIPHAGLLFPLLGAYGATHYARR